MDNFERQAVLVQLIEKLREYDSWCGETHVQKATFFLENLCDHTLGYRFILYKHGPYSFDLSDEIAAMRAFGFVDWDIPSLRYGPRLKTTHQAQQLLLRNYGRLADSLDSTINFVVSNLSPYGVATLERLATALYFTSSEEIPDRDARARKIHSVKPHITEAQALSAIVDVDQIMSRWGTSEYAITPGIKGTTG